MRQLVARILASAARKMWQDDATLGRYTVETAQHELNLAFHYAAELRNWFSWLDCDFDVTKSHFDRRRPDIIIHRRRSRLLNFLVVEVKRGIDVEGADNDLEKIRQFWFGGNPRYRGLLDYRFGASVILGDRHGSFDVRVLERAAPLPVLSIPSQNPFQLLAPPRYSRVRRETLRTIVETVATGHTQERTLDEAVFRLFGIN